MGSEVKALSEHTVDLDMGWMFSPGLMHPTQTAMVTALLLRHSGPLCGHDNDRQHCMNLVHRLDKHKDCSRSGHQVDKVFEPTK
jgi:hypothetical protein